MNTMKAIVYKQYGPPEVLQLQDLPIPKPKDNEVLIKVHATTVTAGDWRVRKADPFLVRIMYGLFKPTKAPILGFELSGEIVDTGKAVTKFKKGDQVIATPGYKFGAYCEYKCLAEDAVMVPKPANISFEEAAAVPIGGITALYFLREKANVQNGQKVCIHGASGSVGTFAVQIAKYFGAAVTAICSTANVDLVRSLNPDNVIDYKREEFTNHPVKYDIIFDAAGKLPLSRCKQVLAPKGQYISVAKGSAKIRTEYLLFLKELLESGHLKPVIDRRYALQEIVAAHHYVQQQHKKGNVIVNVI